MNDRHPILTKSTLPRVQPFIRTGDKSEDRELDLKINEIINQLNQMNITPEYDKSRFAIGGLLCDAYRSLSRMKKLCKDQCSQLYKKNLSWRFSEIKVFLEFAIKELGESHRLREYDKDGNSKFDVPKLDS